MTITDQGREKVREALVEANERLAKVNKEFEAAVKRVEELSKADQCLHVNLVDRGGYTHDITQCEDCGFTWYD